MNNYVTARDLEVTSKATAKGTKKPYWCRQYDEPVVVISGMSFSSGKHGVGKTRLNCTSYFTQKKVSLLLDSSEPFYQMKTHASYTMYNGVCISYNAQAKVAQFMIEQNGSYKTITLELESDIEEGSTQKIHAFYNKSTLETHYKI